MLAETDANLQDNIEKDPGAIYLSEHLFDLNEGASFLDELSSEAALKLRAAALPVTLLKNEHLFQHGEPHTGVWIIEKGRVRSFYTGPSGREITLAYWSEGHFVGGPEVFGRGRHLWSADALEPSELLYLSGQVIYELVREFPEVAIAIIEGLIAKGKCYSALIQMLGTRSVAERLRQLLLILADTHGQHENGQIVLARSITFEQIASIVGATRQWVSRSMENLQEQGVLHISRKEIRIISPELL